MVIGVASSWFVHAFYKRPSSCLRRMRRLRWINSPDEEFKMSSFGRACAIWKACSGATTHMGVDGSLYAFLLFAATTSGN